MVYSKDLMFAIGGYTGFHDDIKSSSYKKISLSRMTFTHEMALLLLIEQIYRSMKILKGGKIPLLSKFWKDGVVLSGTRTF